MAYYHSRPVGDIEAIKKSWDKLTFEQKVEMLDIKKLKQYLFGKDIEELEPRSSTHGTPYVYAAKQKELSLLYGSSNSHGDLDGKIRITPEGKPCFIEAYKGAFTERFKGRSCRLYEVDETNFQEGKTDFSAEVVSELPVKVESETTIKDIKVVLEEAIKNGEFELVTYEQAMANEEYYQMNSHIRNTIIESGILDRPNSKSFKFCMKKFPDLMKQLLEEKEKGVLQTTKPITEVENDNENDGPEME